MSATIITTLFLVALFLSAAIRFWLNFRQVRHVLRHRNAVPTAFAENIELAAHQRAADYTVAKARLGRVDLALSLTWVLLLTLAGGLQFLHEQLGRILDPTSLWHGIALFGAVSVVGFVWDLPLTLYHTFVLEERFGFNRTTLRTFVGDCLKQAAMGIVIGVPLLGLVLWLMQSAGSSWWVWTWAVWLSFNLLMMVLYPLFIAPLFNKFEPLKDEVLAQRITALLARCGFRA